MRRRAAVSRINLHGACGNDEISTASEQFTTEVTESAE